MSLEQVGLHYRVQEVMNKTALEVIEVIDKLTNSIINNYFFNFCQHLQGQKFREVSGLFILLLMLIKRHPYLTAYICFQVRDYTYLNETFSCIPIIGHFDSTDLRSVTFIECLFKIKYFYVHSQDLFAIAKLFTSFYTGITIAADSEDSRSLLDFSHIIVIKLMRYMDVQLKEKFSTPHDANVSPGESYGILYNSLSALSCILNNMNWSDLRLTGFGRDFKAAFLSLIKQTLRALKFSSSNDLKILKDYGEVDVILVSVLDMYYDRQLKLTSCSNGQIEVMKYQAYGELVTSIQQQENQTQSSSCSSNSKKVTPFQF